MRTEEQIAADTVTRSLDEVLAAWTDMASATRSVHEMLAIAPREEVFETLLDLAMKLGPQRSAHMAAGALLALADTQAELAKTESNFEEYAETAAEELADLRAKVAEVAS